MPLQTADRPRSPWQLLYARALEVRRRRLSVNARALPRPVISIGNLHWGGGGKTPLVAALASALRDRGRHVTILTRGYRRRGPREPEILSLGEGPLLSVERAGDEPYLLARELPGVSIVVGAERYRAGQLALQRETPVDLFLLDDGFSHAGLRRDLDVLVFPASNPFAGARLLPSGRLREPLSASRFADAAVLTGLDSATSEWALDLDGALRPFGFSGPVFASRTEVSVPEADALRRRKVLLVSGVAHPRSVESSAQTLASTIGFELSGHLAFPDHHAYPERSVRKIQRVANRLGCRVLTTTKDLAKLEGRLGERPLAIELRARPEPALVPWLEQALDHSGSGSPTSKS